LKAVYIYGAMDQSTREDRLMKFRQRKVNFLLVTDLAARGIDIPLLENVIHYDFPTSLKLYIHRSGRTARAGQKGTSYSIITNDEIGYLHDLSVYVGKKYVDSLESLKAQSKEEIDPAITIETIAHSPEYVIFGRLPQNTLDEYTVYAENVINKNI
jgi:ATP-dependent RNA helicase DDX54/DBP10